MPSILSNNTALMVMDQETTADAGDLSWLAMIDVTGGTAQTGFVPTLAATEPPTGARADMEAAAARLQALQRRQQLGLASLPIANRQPQTMRALFRP